MQNSSPRGAAHRTGSRPFPSRDDLALLFFGVVMGGAVGWAILGDIAKAACVPPAGRAEFGCLEFWLNRYQSLIGSGLTAVIAGLTLIWVTRQFDASHRQTAIAGATALRLRVNELEAERALVRRSQELLELLSVKPERIGVYDPMVDLENIRTQHVAAWDKLADCIRELQTFELGGDASLAAAPRKQSVMFLFSMQSHLSLGLAAIGAIQRRGAWEHSKAREELFRHWAANVRRAFEADTALRQMDGALRSEIEATLKQIQSFERIAIGEG